MVYAPYLSFIFNRIWIVVKMIIKNLINIVNNDEYKKLIVFVITLMFNSITYMIISLSELALSLNILF